MLSTWVSGASSACSSKRRWKHCYSGMYSAVSSMPRGSGRMIRRATTTGSLPLSKSLLRTLLKRVSVSRRKVASFPAGMRYQSDHLAEFCRKCSLCFRSIAVSWSGNRACSVKEVARDSCSSTRLGTHRYSGDDSQSGCGTQANTYSDRTRSQGASSDPGEGSLARRLNGRQLYVWHAVDSEGEVPGHPRSTTARPQGAPVSRPVQRIKSIRSHALLGGLHHHYVRV